MVAVVPFKYNAVSKTEIPRSESYFFDSVIKTHPELYSRIGISDEADAKIRQIITKEREDFEKKLTDILGNDSLLAKLFPSAMTAATNPDAPLFDDEYNEDLFLFRGEPPSVLLRRSNNSFTLVSKTIEDVENLLKNPTSYFDQIGRVTKDFGLSFNGITTGKEYAVQMLEKYGIKKFDTAEPQNDFEKQVMKDVGEITNCLLTNAQISFASENAEYDILIPYDEGATINIEVTDYAQAK